MSNLVIVAIPDENDRVWKISSEKIPHLTLLFLGDVDQVSNTDQIVQFVEHAASQTLRRFYLPVDRRDELGDDPDLGSADVLFFKKGRYDYKAIRDFRVTLLKDDNIRTAYDSATQHEGVWLPHLTLGYKNRPAKPDDTDRDFGFYDVSFNKIAVWLDDYDGPDFLLKDYWDEWEALETVPMDVAMSAIKREPDAMAQTADLGAAFLAHYGVKGMKWGVRRDPKTETKKGQFDPEGHDLGSDLFKAVVWPMVPPLGIFAIPAEVRLARGAGRGIKAKGVDIQEKRFEKKAASAKNFAAIHNGSVERSNRELENINKKYANKDLTKDAAAQKRYDAEVLKMMQDSYKESANAIGNKANTRHLDVEFKGDGMDVKISAKEGPATPLPKRVRHAAMDEEEDFVFHAKFKRLPTGHIVGFEFEDFEPPKDMAQSAIEAGSEFVLEHYGVKGMQWGVRRNRGTPTAVTPSATSRVPHGTKRKTKIETEGGENHPAHDDAIKVAQAKAKLQKSGAAALSNNELREVANRLQLEQQVKQLTTSGGKKFVTGLLRSEGQQGSQQLLRKGVKKGGRGARKVALGF